MSEKVYLFFVSMDRGNYYRFQCVLGSKLLEVMDWEEDTEITEDEFAKSNSFGIHVFDLEEFQRHKYVLVPDPDVWEQKVLFLDNPKDPKILNHCVQTTMECGYDKCLDKHTDEGELNFKDVYCIKLSSDGIVTGVKFIDTTTDYGGVMEDDYSTFYIHPTNIFHEW